MKKLFLGLGLVALLAGCASGNNGMGGTGDEYNQESGYNSSGDNSSNQFHSNAANGTGTETATNRDSDGTIQ